MPKEPALDTRAARAKAREEFFRLDIKTLDRALSPLQKKEWTDIYSSFRAGTPIAGTVSGKEEIELTVRNKETGRPERISVLCFTVINYRVKVLIPETALWNNGKYSSGMWPHIWLAPIFNMLSPASTGKANAPLLHAVLPWNSGAGHLHAPVRVTRREISYRATSRGWPETGAA